MFGNDIKLYIALEGSGIPKKVSFEKPKHSNNSSPIRIPPITPSVTIELKAPYEEQVKALQSQMRFYGSKDSIKQSLH